MVKGHLPCWSAKRNWNSSNACSWESLANGSGTTVPSTSKTQPINATNMCIMNAKGERRSDSRNFSTRITEFGVVVGKIQWFEVLRAILWIFLG
jgi:hypothetical protein